MARRLWRGGHDQKFLVGIDSSRRPNRNNGRVLSLMSARQVNPGTANRVGLRSDELDGRLFFSKLLQKQNK
jgi:hypothetical protein